MIIYSGEMEKITFKEIFGDTMEQLAAEDPDVIYLDCDLMNSAGTYKFWKKHPDRAINCGISEANMIGVAAGLSMTGKKVYAHTFGPFASRRCYDQLFLSIGYAKNNLRIVGSDPGVTAAYNGGTHMPFEDLALLRAIPDATVIEISAGVMFKKLLLAIKDRPGLTYIRTSRKNYQAIYSDDTEFEIGRAMKVCDGTDLTIIACGLMTGTSLAAAQKLKERGISARVIDMFTIKPLDEEITVAAAKETGAVVTCENHNVIGGLGDAVAMALFENNCPVPMERVGVRESFGEVGTQDYLQKRFKLTADDIVEAAVKVVEKK